MSSVKKKIDILGPGQGSPLGGLNLHTLAWDIAYRLFSHVFISCSIIMVAVSTALAGSQALPWGLIILPLRSPLKQKAKATGGLTLPELCSESFS